MSPVRYIVTILGRNKLCVFVHYKFHKVRSKSHRAACPLTFSRLCARPFWEQNSDGCRNKKHRSHVMSVLQGMKAIVLCDWHLQVTKCLISFMVNLNISEHGKHSFAASANPSMNPIFHSDDVN